MYFSKIITFGLAAATASAGVIKRDLATFQRVFNTIDVALTDFQTSINALQPTDDVPTKVNEFLGKAAAFDAALSSGATAISATAPLNIFEALGLIPLVTDLSNQADQAVTDLIAKEPLIDANGLNPLVVEELNKAKASGNVFIAAAISKVPAATAGLANTLAQQVITSINRGIVAFGGTV